MADKKISQLTAATTPLAGTEVLPIVQSGSTVKVSIANVTAGRSIATGAITATVADNSGVSIVQSIAGETGFLNFVDSDAGLAGRVKYDHSNNSLQLFSNATEQVRISSGGNLVVNSGAVVITNNVLLFDTDAKGINDANGNELLNFSRTASAVNELTVSNAATGSGPNISATGGDTNININLTPKGSLGNVANRGTSLVTLDSSGIYAVASFGKTGIPDNTATNICILTGDTAMFGFVEILYAISDPGTDIYVGRKTYRMFWDGSALFNLISSEDYSGSLVPTFTASGSGDDFTIAVTANSIAATMDATFTVRWHSFGAPLNKIAIREA